MTTNSIPAGPVAPRSRWFPRSRPAVVVLAVTALGALALLALGALLYWFQYLACFDSCTPADPAATAVFAVLAVTVAAAPLAAVRLYQGDHPERAWAAPAFLLLTAAALVTWNYTW